MCMIIKNNYYLDRFLAFIGGIALIFGIILLFLSWKIGIGLIALWAFLPIPRNYIIKRF